MKNYNTLLFMFIILITIFNSHSRSHSHSHSHSTNTYTNSLSNAHLKYVSISTITGFTIFEYFDKSVKYNFIKNYKYNIYNISYYVYSNEFLSKNCIYYTTRPNIHNETVIDATNIIITDNISNIITDNTNFNNLYTYCHSNQLLNDYIMSIVFISLFIMVLVFLLCNPFNKTLYRPIMH